METLAVVALAVVAALHLGFLYLEMFLWQKPAGMRISRLDPADAKTTATLAANQGLYNGFIAAGLILGILASDPVPIRVFFLVCVIVAGLYGAITAGRTILWVQAVPGVIGLALVLAAGQPSGL
jgi:putative membrane protein